MQNIIAAAAHRPATSDPHEGTYLFAGHNARKTRPGYQRTQSAPAEVERDQDSYTRYPSFRPRRAPIFRRLGSAARESIHSAELHAEASAFRLLMRAAFCWVCCLGRGR